MRGWDASRKRPALSLVTERRPMGFVPFRSWLEVDVGAKSELDTEVRVTAGGCATEAVAKASH